jgi:hypothetical protein
LEAREISIIFVCGNQERYLCGWRREDWVPIVDVYYELLARGEKIGFPLL